jgi:hypothetical protein
MQYVSYLSNDHHFVRHVKLNGFFHSDSLGRILKVIFVLGSVWKGSFRGGAGAVLKEPLRLLFFNKKRLQAASFKPFGRPSQEEMAPTKRFGRTSLEKSYGALMKSNLQKLEKRPFDLLITLIRV